MLVPDLASVDCVAKPPSSLSLLLSPDPFVGGRDNSRRCLPRNERRTVDLWESTIGSFHFPLSAMSGCRPETGKISAPPSVDRLDVDKRPCDALGKDLSCWRHGQRTRFSPAVPKRGKARLLRQRNHRLLVVINTRAPQDTGGRNSVPKTGFTR